ncbi:MAG: hypothetical protein RI556_07285 [Hydrogenovibrio sp.]|uniref:hypothetical protein n=1 Tax=Hydrogenovibrio sp. TaxID=2065821 RepID=UPI0028700C00|nr:hypothetical protein [Hydrogenovibrio sp.]MDR9498961.1 hypothetical protein [Hydrogenovibrio sp.]
MTMSLSASFFAQLGVQPWRLKPEFSMSVSAVPDDSVQTSQIPDAAPSGSMDSEVSDGEAITVAGLQRFLWVEPGLTAAGESAQALVANAFAAFGVAPQNWQWLDPSTLADDDARFDCLERLIDFGPDLALCTDLAHPFVQELAEGVMVEPVPPASQMLAAPLQKKALYQQWLAWTERD